MLFPYKAILHVDMKPIANLVLIGFILINYLASIFYSQDTIYMFTLRVDNIVLGSILSVFMHANLFHLAGNMLYLFVFGNAVNCRLGNLLYTFTFFISGFLASIIHILIDGQSAIGASGAISGIVGFFLVLFPWNKIKCLWVFIGFNGKVEIKSILLILSWLIFDIFFYLIGSEGIAYIAHIAGTFVGFNLAVLFIKLRLVVFWMSDEPLIDN